MLLQTAENPLLLVAFAAEFVFVAVFVAGFRLLSARAPSGKENIVIRAKSKIALISSLCWPAYLLVKNYGLALTFQ